VCEVVACDFQKPSLTKQPPGKSRSSYLNSLGMQPMSRNNHDQEKTQDMQTMPAPAVLALRQQFFEPEEETEAGYCVDHLDEGSEETLSTSPEDPEETAVRDST
jgi:hypothetical protein